MKFTRYQALLGNAILNISTDFHELYRQSESKYNEKQFEEAVKTTLTELCSMSQEEFHAEMEKRKNSDFARIFSEANESSYHDDSSFQINQARQYKFFSV